MGGTTKEELRRIFGGFRVLGLRFRVQGLRGLSVLGARVRGWGSTVEGPGWSPWRSA